MGTAQLIILISGLIILSLLGLQIFSTLSRNTDSDMYNQALLTGTGIAQSMLEEIQGKAFDEKTVSQTITSADTLTAITSLGPDGSESTNTTFDDIDDYNNYQKTDSLSVFGTFTSSVKVYYVLDMNPDTKSSSRTFTKRIDVCVLNKYLIRDGVFDTLKLTGIKAY